MHLTYSGRIRPRTKFASVTANGPPAESNLLIFKYNHCKYLGFPRNYTTLDDPGKKREEKTFWLVDMGYKNTEMK